MNREKKFRAWDLDANDRMYSWEEIQHNLAEHIKNNRIHVMQYTGLKDKHGNEIYEGDLLGELVKIDGEEVMSSIPVLWSNEESAFCVDLSFVKDGTYLELLSHNYQGMEIIGNIYESPELTNKTK